MSSQAWEVFMGLAKMTWRFRIRFPLFIATIMLISNWRGILGLEDEPTDEPDEPVEPVERNAGDNNTNEHHTDTSAGNVEVDTNKPSQG